MTDTIVAPAPDPIEAEYIAAAVALAEADYVIEQLPDTDWDVWLRLYGPAMEKLQSAFERFVAAKAALKGEK